MENKKNYYLLVSVDDIYNKHTSGKVVVIDNNKARDSFKKYNIPQKYRKMVIKVSVGGIAEPVDAFELITNKMFYFKIPFLESVLKPKANPIIEVIAKDIRLIVDNRLYHAEAVKEFYQEIINDNLALNYGNAVREILDVPRKKNTHNIFTRTKKKKY